MAGSVGPAAAHVRQPDSSGPPNRPRTRRPRPRERLARSCDVPSPIAWRGAALERIRRPSDIRISA